MRALAEFAMRGRPQAYLVALLSTCTSLFFWVGAAIAALVTLRKGIADGFMLTLWACLPAAAVAFFVGEILPLAAVLGTFVLAAVLRYTVSWSATLAVAPMYGLIMGAVLLTLGSDYLNFLVEMLDALIANIEKGMQSEEQTVSLLRPDATTIAGGLVMMEVFVAILCLILGRWWQASLYNPGGFGEEFRALRFPPGLAVLLVAIAVGFLAMGKSYALWAWAMLVPLLFAGLGLVHGLCHGRESGGRWLTMLYIGLLLIAPLRNVVALLALIDSFIDVRRRVNTHRT